MANFWDKTKDTFEDIMNEIIKGGAQGVEGIRTGFLTYVSHPLAGMLGEKERQQDIKRRITDESDIDKFIAMIEQKGNTFSNGGINPGNNFFLQKSENMRDIENSYINQMGETGQRLTYGVLQGVGQMLPIIATGNIAGALGLSAKTAQTLSMTQLFLSAAGGSSEQALNEGASMGQAQAYGALSGGVEVLTEKLTGQLIPVFGAGVVDNAIAKISTNKLWKVAAGAAGEGFEEMLSQALQPFLEKITYNSDRELWDENQTQEVLMSGLVGALTSIALGAGGNNLTTSNEELLSDLNMLEEKSARVYNRGLDNTNIESTISKTTDKISQRLSKMSLEERATYIKENKLQNYFNEDGTVIARNNSQAISQAARQGNLPKNIKLSETINQEQRSVLQIANKMNKKVVFENNKNNDINAYYDPDTQTIVINSNAKNNDYRTHFVHELTHQLEGTKQYGAFVEYLINQASTNEKFQSILKSKGITAEEIAQVYAKGNKSDDYVILTEFVSRATSEVLFTDQTQIENIINGNKSVGQKIYDWIKKQIKALKNPKTKEERAYLNMLKKAEKLYSAALENEQGGVKLSDIDNRYSIVTLENGMQYVGADRQVFKGDDVSFYPNQLQSYINTKVRENGEWIVPTQDNKGIIINNTSGKKMSTRDRYYDKSEGKTVSLNDSKFLTKLNAATHIDELLTVSKFVGESEDLNKKHQNRNLDVEKWQYRTGHFMDFDGQYYQVKLSVAIGGNNDMLVYNINHITKKALPNFFGSKALSNANNAILQQNETDVNQLNKDSDGHVLSKEQVEYFKDSKARDEKGALKVLYHGTNNTFFEFAGDGYFTDDVKVAQTYDSNLEEDSEYVDFVLLEGYVNLTNPFVLTVDEYWDTIKNPFSDRGEIVTTEDIAREARTRGYDGVIFERVTDVGAHADPNNEITSNVYVIFDANQFKSSDNSDPTSDNDFRYSLTDTQETALKDRKVFGDDLLNAQDLASDILKVNGEITSDAKAVLYHATSEENAKRINESGIMIGKEDWLYYSTKKDGEIKGYGNSVVRVEIPLELLELNDIFDDEAHLTLETKIGKATNIRFSKDSNGNVLTDQQRKFFRNTQVLDDDGNLKVLFHGTPYGKFYQFKGSMLFFSESKKFAEQYAQEKSFNEGLDAETTVYEVYLNSKKLLDTRNENQVRELVDSFDVENMKYGFANKTYTKEEWINNILGNVESRPMWTKEQINNAEFGKVIGNDKYGYNNDLFIGIDSENNVVHSRGGYLTEYVKHLDEQQIKQLISGEAVEVKLVKGRWNDQEYRELFGNEPSRFDYEKEIIRPYKTTQEVEYLTGVDNWTNIELTYDSNSKKSVVDYIRELGYDGIKMFEDGQTNYAVFRTNQIKLTSNENPTISKDIRFSKNPELLAKEKAKYTKEKVFNKKDAETVINNILDEYMAFKNYDGKLTNKTKDQVIRSLWKELNTAHKDYRGKVAVNLANYIIEHAIAEEVYQTNLVDYEFLDASEFYKRKLDLDSMKNEIQNAFGKDKSIFGVFGKRRGVKATTVENMIEEFKSKGITIDGQTIQDQLINFYKRYKQSKNNIKKSIKSLKSVLSNEEMTELKNDVVRTVLNAFDEQGKLTPYHNQMLKIKNLKGQLKDARVYSTALSKMMNSVDRVAGLEKYKSVEDIPLSQEIVGLVKLLKKVKTWRGNLATANSIRNIMSKYASKVQDENGKLIPLYDLYSGVGITDRNDFGEMVEEIASGNGALTVDEIRQIDLILTNFVHNVKNFDKVFFEGKVQERSVIAREINTEMNRVTPLTEGGMKELLGNYTRWVQSPIWRFDRLSNYHSDGFFPRFYQELLGGVSKQVEFKRDVSQLYENFFKKHKKVAKSWREQTFDVNGVKLSKGQMISLYMLSFREQAQTHLFNIEEDKGIIRISDEKSAKAFKYKEAISGGNDLEITPTIIKEIESKLTLVDKDYIKLTKKFFNVLSKNAKTKTDVALYGVTNVVDGEYFPIRVSDDVLYKQIGDNGFGFGNMFSVYSASFNKDVKRNAKNKVVIENVLDVVERHAQQMSSYYGLAIPIKSFNQIWNTQVDENVKVSSVVSKIDKSFERYVSDLFKAMQGIRAQKTSFDRVMGKIRGNWAKAALGFNPKVVATQFASLLASHGGGIRYGNLMKGIYQATTGKTNYEKLYDNSPLMWDRAQEGFNVDLGLLKEQKGLLGNLDKLTEISTSLIGKTDNFVIGAIWNAALEQTKSQYKLHSKEHYQAAAKLVESVTFRTQANWTAIARPSILQTDNALLQTFTMFMSEPLQIFSQIAGNIDRVRIARKELKAAKSDAEIKAAKDRIKVASNQVRQYSVAMVSGAVYLSIVGVVFKWIKYGFDDEEEAKKVAYDEALGYFIGTMPFIRDIYSLAQGYELSNMYETGLSNMWKGGNALWNMSSGVFEADYTSRNFMKDSRTLILGISQTLGVPLKNLETYIKGIIGKVDEEITYRYESNFYKQSYSSDLKAAIESNNNKLADTIVDLMLKNKNVGVTNDAVIKEMQRLSKLNYNVMPKAMLTSINVDGNSVKLTNKQYKSFQGIYSQSEKEIAKMIKSSGYASLSDEAKSKAVKLTYDYYYNLAKEDLTGEDYNGKLGIAAKAVKIDKLSLVIAFSRTTSGSTKKSQIINFMIKQGISMRQRNVILAYLGYAVDDSTTSYLKSLGITQDEIMLFLT